MNKQQQFILAIVTPLMTLLLAYGYILKFMQWGHDETGLVWRPTAWNDFQETWLVWLITLIIIAIAELLIFSKDPKK